MTHARLHHGTLESKAAGRAVDYRVITPPGWTSAARLPLLLVLHGANSAASVLEGQAALLGGMWADGSLPPLIAGCVTVPTRGGFYIDWPGDCGRWETLVSAEFPVHLQDRFGADLRQLMIAGASMGGYGAIAFRDPARFVAVAVMAPAVFPCRHSRRSGRGTPSGTCSTCWPRCGRSRAAAGTAAAPWSGCG